MKALVKKSPGKGNTEIAELDKPTIPASDWVLVKVAACGVCGTDVHVWQDKFMHWPPVTLGHEFSGIVEEIGKGCVKAKIGQRVVAEPGIHACGVCEFCRSGRMHLCYTKQTLGWRTHGAMAEYIAMPEKLLHVLPNDLDLTLAALCEPLAVAVYSVAERGRVNIGDFTVVQGSGPIGMLCAYMAKALGAGAVLLTGITASELCRFDAARKLGADIIVNVEKENLSEVVMDLTDGYGADCVIEASGVAAAIEACASLAKKNGRVIGVGLPEGDAVPFRWKEAALKALEIQFSMSTSYTSWDKALSLLHRDSDIIQKIITWTGGIENWERIFKELVEEKQVKAVFTF